LLRRWTIYLDIYLAHDNGGINKIGPFFPDGRSLLGVVRHRITSGELQEEQYDWGAWFVRVSPAQIRSITEEFFGDPPRFTDGYRLDLYHALREFVASLDEGRTYRLVASET
jgi:hypothetical protein